jgi:hypothetical protein
MAQREIAPEAPMTPVPVQGAGDALVDKIDHVIEARVQERMARLQPGGESDRGRNGLGLALVSLGLALPITAPTTS